MKPTSYKVILLFAELLAGCLNQRCADAAVISVRFSPEGGCEKLIVETIDQAEKEIEYWMYAFTSEPIADALVRARGRGVRVTMVLDHLQSKNVNSQARKCAAAGCTVLIDRHHKIMHVKSRVVDGRLVLWGSYNDTNGAEHDNAEVVTLDDNESLCKTFMEEFAKHKRHAVPLDESLKLDKANARKRKRKAEMAR